MPFLKVTFDGSDERVVAAFRYKGQQIVSSVREELDLLMFELLRRVQQKLSGGVLQTRSGHLLGSANKEPTIISGSGKQIIGSVSAGAGLAMKYASVHEKGGRGWYDIYPVKAKALAWTPTGGLPWATKRGVIFAKHVHHPPLPKRSYMQSSLDEMRAEIFSRIFAAAARGLQS